LKNLINLSLQICIILSLLLSGCKGRTNHVEEREVISKILLKDSIWVDYTIITGIGYEEGISRRDPSDIIKVGDKYYIWYTRIPAKRDGKPTPLYNSGYYGTIWYAISEDEGNSWVEQGEALGKGTPGTFDSHAVFTPNIISVKGKYYLYYTAVMPTPNNKESSFENNSKNDFTAIGVAVAESPDGPFIRDSNNPILSVSTKPADFDSYRVDDASLLVRDGKYWLYYKGRSMADGLKGPAHTQMGVAFAKNPAGPFQKHASPILDKSHEVLIWNYENGVMALASISNSLEFAPDGLDFKTGSIDTKLDNRPSAPGLYRPHLSNPADKEVPGWGISMQTKTGDIFLVLYKLNFRLDN
jgi:predicted GH43/DUF377 family glycosyl hydrolase